MFSTMSPENMKVVKAAIAAGAIYYFFFKRGVQHNAQATVLEMMQKVGIPSQTPTTKMAIVSLMLAYLFKDQFPMIGDLFEKVFGIGGSSLLTGFVEPDEALKMDMKNEIKKADAAVAAEKQTMAVDRSPPPAPPPPTRIGANGIATFMDPKPVPGEGNLMKNFAQVIM